MTRHALELAPEQLKRATPPDSFTFSSTAEITFAREIIGQPRGVRAIEFGVDIDSPGYNIYVLGPTGSGRTTAIKQFLEQRALSGQTPLDWVYVYNFEVEHQPRAIELPPGRGAELRDDMERLITVLRREIPAALEAEEFSNALEQLDVDFSSRRSEIFDEIMKEAKQKSCAIIRTPSGLVIAPLDEKGEIMPPEQYEALEPAAREAIDQARIELDEKLNEVLRRGRDLDREHTEARAQLERGAAAYVLVQHIGDLREKYEGRDEVLFYLNQVRDDVLDHLDDFKHQEDAGSEGESVPMPMMNMAVPDEVRFRRYQVNLIVDHSQTKGAPVVLEEFPSYANLVGRIEGEVQMGALNTGFTGIKAGALHRANGGYLVLRADDVLSQPDAWDGLKRALQTGVVRIEESGLRTGLGVLIPQTIDPEPIPLRLKVILLGNPALYYMLYASDEDFSDLFKVKADFSSTMDRTPESEMDYATFIAARCHERQLPHFSRAAVARIIEEGSRMTGDQDKLSTLFGELSDLIQEAAYWARSAGSAIVEDEHVVHALAEQRYRANLHEERTLETIRRNQIFIDTTGSVVGQVNGLSVVGLGDYEFGQPSRITARVYLGREGLVNIEREVEMSGPIHDKGVYTLRGYLGGQYASSQPLALTASITFEQTYAGIEGDSAAASELFALLSALSGFPIRQSIAVTGSVNQHGQIQPIGGVNEKIEGFFRVCQLRGLAGDQGAVIPRANLSNLMLRQEVIDAVQAGQFHVYAIETVDEGLEILTGVPAGLRGPDGAFPAGTVHAAAQQRLAEMADRLRGWLRDGG